MTDPRETPARSLSPEDVALELGIHRETVYRWIRAGRLAAARIGPRLWRVSPDDLERFKRGEKRE